MGDEKLTSREDQIGFLFLYVQSDENTLPKVNKVSKTEAESEKVKAEKEYSSRLALLKSLVSSQRLHVD